MAVRDLTGGEFIKIGRSQAVLDDISSLEDLRQRRENLQRSLNQLDREITELQGPTGSKEKKD